MQGFLHIDAFAQLNRVQAGVEHLIAVCAATTLSPTPLLPEVDLYVAEDTYSVWEMTTHADTAGEPPVPFWSFPWPGGQALARYLLDQPELVAGRRVLDLAAGSGLVGIAAALAGAAQVTAIDVDPFAAAAQTMNARANEVALEVVLADVLDDETPDYDVVLAGDVCYERELTERMLGYLRRARANGADVLLGDPGRTYLPRTGLTEVAAYDVPTTLALEDAVTKRTTVWRVS
jgi:predicted nicotinamide N-methyase